MSKEVLKKLRNFVMGFILLIALCLASEAILDFLGLKFPAPLLAMLMLFLLLKLNIVDVEFIRPVCKFLLGHMLICFVPFVVGIVLYKDVFEGKILMLTFLLILSTVITYVAVGYSIELATKLKSRYKR